MKELIYDFYGDNTQLFHIINNACNGHKIQYFLKVISTLFDIEMFAIYYIIITALLLYRITRTKNYEHYSFCYDFMVKIGICYACFGLTYAALKFGFKMPRPFCSLPEGSFTTIIDISKERCLSSFPSSHTGLAFLITIFLWEYIRPLMRTFWLLLVALVALSRIALAMHFPADIFYSLFIAYIVYEVAVLTYGILEGNIVKWIKDRVWRIVR